MVERSDTVPILVAVADNREGTYALRAAVREAQRLDTEVLVVTMGVRAVDLSDVPHGVSVRVLPNRGRPDRDPVDEVLDAIEATGAERLVVCLKRRSPVGKVLLGSISQRLLLDSPVPVLAVRIGQG